MKHQYTYTFFNVNKTVFKLFSVSHLTEEMVKCYTIQQHLPTITYNFQTHLKYCVQQTLQIQDACVSNRSILYLHIKGPHVSV